MKLLSYANLLMNSYVVYNGKRLRYHMFSTELPPLLALGGTKAKAIMGTLRSEFGGSVEGGTEVVQIKPFASPAVLVWIVASVASRPSRSLLRALMSYTPRSAIDLIFELVDTGNGYSKSKPLIGYNKLFVASKIVVKILKLHNYPVEDEKE